jgi:hypothetical protein
MMDPNTPVTPAPRPPWPRAWTWALVLAGGLFGAHATACWWGPALFGDLPSIADLSPLVMALLAGWIILSLAGGMAVGLLIGEGLSARDQHRWQHEQAERQRQWAQERQDWQRLQEIRDQLWLESLPEPDRERILARRREERELQQRARAILDAERQGDADGR